jgi:hypothetical protein
MDERIKTVVEQLLRTTANSLGRSLRNYWPAADSNDPRERNMSLHFSHAMLRAGFSVFREADPKRVDVLGLEPDCKWFLASEFKQLHSKSQLLPSPDSGKKKSLLSQLPCLGV